MSTGYDVRPYPKGCGTKCACVPAGTTHVHYATPPSPPSRGAVVAAKASSQASPLLSADQISHLGTQHASDQQYVQRIPL